MICASIFPGDEDERLFRVQHEAYPDFVWTILQIAKERYLNAEAVLRCAAPMSIQVRQLELWDYRAAQDIHDLIAAYYRFKRRTELLFPLEPNLREDWYWFLRKEAVALCESADFVTGVLDACLYANTEVGNAGEKRAKDIQRARYWRMLEYTLPRFQLEEEP